MRLICHYTGRILSQPFGGGGAMTDFTREEIRSQLNMQGFDPPEPEFTEVVYRINALIEGLKKLDDLDVYHTEPWPVMPYRGLPQRSAGQGSLASGGAAEPHDPNIAFMTIREQANLIKSGKLSPVELTQTYLDRIDRYDSKLHAFNLVLRDEALAAAKAAEVEIASGKYRGPMHGIPMGVKDQFDIKGHLNTGGCDAYDDNIAREDSTIIARFREAGGIIMGTLATHEFHMGGTLEFFNQQTPRNPWDLDKSPAGSSAGSGSSVAAGLLSGAMGGDTGGSIRGPASVNGITGLRPSWGRLSRQGIFTLAWELDTAGPLARSAEDTAIMLQAIAGYDPKDPTTSQVPVPDYSQSLTGDIKDLRIGVLEQMMGDEVKPETRSLVQRAIDVLKDLGAKVEPVSIPLIERMHGVHTAICDGQAASYHRGHLRARYMAYDYNTRVRLLVGCLIPAGLQTLAGRARALMGHTMLETFETYDVLVGATGQGPADPIVTESAITSREAAQTAVMARSGGTGSFSMAGAAAISIPAGFTPSGMPVGWHLGTRPMDEETLFRVCHAYQLATDHHQKHPPMGVTEFGA
ncbi:MAG: amidase [Candidatus Tectomicrobia bacterium]|nr:amidase [Candidatus Tectomicrobia bacterium]